MKCNSSVLYGLGSVLVICFSANAAQAAISDNFNDGNDTGWTRYEPLAPYGAPGVFSFPIDPELLGVGYRIQASASPNPVTLGAGRVGSFRLDETDSAFSQFFILKDWDNGARQSIGCIARAREIGFGSIDGYTFTYSTDGFAQIARMDNEVLTPLATSTIFLDPAKDYRFHFSGFGSGLSGEVYEVTDLTIPVALVRIRDTVYDTGVNGLLVWSNTGDGIADATFDRFETGILVPEPSTLSLLALAGLSGLWIAYRRRINSR